LSLGGVFWLIVFVLRRRRGGPLVTRLRLKRHTAYGINCIIVAYLWLKFQAKALTTTSIPPVIAIATIFAYGSFKD